MSSPRRLASLIFAAARTPSALLFAACLPSCDPAPPPPEADEPEAATSLVLELPELGEPQAESRSVRVEVLDVVVEPDGGDATLSLTLRLHHRRRASFDGGTTRQRDLRIERRDIQVIADGTPLASLDPASDSWRLVAASHGRARLTAAFRIPHGVMPKGMMLRVVTDEGDAHLWLAGSPPPDTRWVLPIAPDGAPLPDAEVQVHTTERQGTDATRAGPDAPFAVPRVGSQVRIYATSPGYHAAVYDSQWASLPPMSRLALDPASAQPGLAFARATHGAFPVNIAFLDAAGATEVLADDDALIAWVREDIRPLPTHGLQRSPDTTARLRAGGSVDRAVLLSTLLRARGHDTRLACGDLTADQADALYRTPASLQMDGPPGARLVQAASEAESLAPSIAEALLARADLPEGRPTQHGLIPEWCWVQRRDGDAYVNLDLRPGHHADLPLPFIWRTDDRISRWHWPTRIRVRALLAQGDPASPSGFDNVDLGEHLSHAALLTERAVILDLWPSPGGGALKSALRVATRRELITEEGPTLNAGQLLRIYAEIDLVDPSGLLTHTAEFGLWERGEEGSPEALRVFLSGDAGASTQDPLHDDLHRALADLTPLHAESLLRVEHSLHHAIRRHALGDAVALGPSLLATVLTAHGGVVYTRRAELLPQAAAPVAAPPPTAARARLGAAEVAALRSSGHWGALEAPNRWATAPHEVASIGSTDARVGLEATRRIQAGAVAAASASAGSLWLIDPIAGDLFPHPVTPTPSDMPAPTLSAAHPIAGWSAPFRCEWARLAAPHRTWDRVPDCARPPSEPQGAERP